MNIIHSCLFEGISKISVPIMYVDFENFLIFCFKNCKENCFKDVVYSRRIWANIEEMSSDR